MSTKLVEEWRVVLGSYSKIWFKHCHRDVLGNLRKRKFQLKHFVISLELDCCFQPHSKVRAEHFISISWAFVYRLAVVRSKRQIW